MKSILRQGLRRQRSYARMGFEMPAYELPALPYDYDALEPSIDSRIMELHHDRHHQGYVDGANAALDRLEEMRDSGDFSGIKAVKRNLSLHTSGHATTRCSGRPAMQRWGRRSNRTRTEPSATSVRRLASAWTTKRSDEDGPTSTSVSSPASLPTMGWSTWTDRTRFTNLCVLQRSEPTRR